ncbi:gamma-aminobutyrate:proton symporter (AAT family) [Streptomyces sp. 2333.5]|uniref:amino acid permease n=1 Tax=Streptomyces TaxID=1883 RepID=UPI00089C8B8B|nr:MULTISPECIES: amino acid permease [unclassified Streptomyces]PJJ00228.1 gamma-aminobutyrate:proton symporter (AAT family) [Streptomyces sp. 2333.5]SEB81478.1 gamma-aminobutyrate:proton symporter, AAT family [Streptomyces sp. 2314.4]SEC69136.1 gamma-aminobutyrate:proton symporter, AAT family [Streptomyces sp. 2112.2]SOE15680.1 gamma-aminobutyrate:proton symporter, AAT family [Streptomyces sp. 2323.1]
MSTSPSSSVAAPPAPPGNGQAPEQSGLQSGLKNRHLSMIAVGGVIGAGLFVGSASGIAAAGPGILLSYALVGALVVFVMRMLGEMAAANPTSGSFSAYADRALGRWAGFSIGWLYWFFWVVVLAVEATAGAAILTSWVPAVPQWAWALIVMIVLTATNLASVSSFGEFEFWFAGIKVVAIAAFIALGGLAIFGVLPGTHHAATGFGNLTSHGGFLPHGPSAILTGVLMVVFSFMGSEIVTLAAGESEDPERAVTKATKSVIWRVGIFYLGSILVVVSLLPWNSPAIAKKGSYVAALDSIGIPHAGQIMNVIVLTAVLSCLNSGLYTASRMAFSLGQRGDAPKAFARTNSRGVPQAAILASVLFGFIAVGFNYLWPTTVFQFLLNSSGAVALFVWLVICFSQLRMRGIIQRESPEKLIVRMWLFPYLTWATIAMISFVLVYMLTDDSEGGGRIQVLLSLLIAVLVVGISLVRDRLGRGSAEKAAVTTR